VQQDAARDAIVLDYGDQLHALATPRTRQHVEIPRTAQQRRPRKPALALGIVGTSGTVCARRSGWNSSSTARPASAS
jgi:hypothetical protein